MKDIIIHFKKLKRIKSIKRHRQRRLSRVANRQDVNISLARIMLNVS